MIYALLNHKGGVGKTTLAVHIAAALAKRGRRIMLVDADPQGSALDWSASRQAEPLFPVIGLPQSFPVRLLEGAPESLRSPRN